MVETNLLNNLPAKMVEMSAYQNPLKRNARTSDVSSVISFLASEQADYLNGTNISVNGGNILF
jgi:3-oxoacyl-[acyl-carrier protein] reductase